MKRILLSLSMIVFVGAVVIGATGAFFSDTEVSTGNTFTAGAIDLTVDSKQHYNGMVCVLGEQSSTGTWQPEDGTKPPFYPAEDSPCVGTWEATDLGVQQFFNFADIKPGDSGENTVSLHVLNNDAWLRMIIKDVTDLDNTCTEPEQGTNGEACTVGTPEGSNAGMGELRENLLFTVFSDNGDDDNKCNNILDGDENTLISSGTVDSLGETWPLPTPITGGQTVCFGITWDLPSTVGNETQTDSMGATMEFEVVQSRNNPTPWPFTPSTP